MKPSCALFHVPFYFLRHGETDLNRLGLVAGQSDVELNETGRTQARASAELLKARGITSIYSSPLKRARDTAEAAATALGLQIIVVPELAERNWGELEGKPRELQVRDAAPPGGEGLEEFSRRTVSGLASIPASGLPLIVAHSGTFRVLCAELGIARGEASVENGRPLRFDPPSSTAGPWTISELQGRNSANLKSE